MTRLGRFAAAAVAAALLGAGSAPAAAHASPTHAMLASLVTIFLSALATSP